MARVADPEPLSILAALILTRILSNLLEYQSSMMAIILFSSLAATLVAIALLVLLTKPRIRSGQVTRIILLRTRFTPIDIATLVLQALLKHIPGYSPSLIAGKTGTQEFDLPEIRSEGVLRIEHEDIATFLKAVDSQATDSSTPEKDSREIVNPFFLVSQTVPLVIAIIASRSCPIKPLGAVNTKNVLRFLNPVLCRDAKALKAAADADELSYGASLKTTGRRRKRGVEFCLSIDVFTSTDIIMRQECFFLQFLPRSVEPKWDGTSDESQEISAKQCHGVAGIPLVIRAEDPLLWADSSKDWNPIHVSTIGAKLFGFSNVIAHGNHLAALAFQQLQNISDASAKEARHLCWLSKTPFSIELRFARPMVLPATASVKWERSDTGEAGSKARMTIWREGKMCMEGSIISA